jgi:hypothetical protein
VGRKQSSAGRLFDVKIDADNAHFACTVGDCQQACLAVDYGRRAADALLKLNRAT